MIHVTKQRHRTPKRLTPFLFSCWHRCSRRRLPEWRNDEIVPTMFFGSSVFVDAPLCRLESGRLFFVPIRAQNSAGSTQVLPNLGYFKSKRQAPLLPTRIFFLRVFMQANFSSLINYCVGATYTHAYMSNSKYCCYFACCWWSGLPCCLPTREEERNRCCACARVARITQFLRGAI